MIRCYLKYSLTERTPADGLQDHFQYPEEGATLESFYRSLEEHIRVSRILVTRRTNELPPIENHSLGQHRRVHRAADQIRRFQRGSQSEGGHRARLADEHRFYPFR